jgi:hypothetical protein
MTFSLKLANYEEKLSEATNHMEKKGIAGVDHTWR